MVGCKRLDAGNGEHKVGCDTCTKHYKRLVGLAHEVEGVGVSIARDASVAIIMDRHIDVVGNGVRVCAVKSVLGIKQKTCAKWLGHMIQSTSR